MNGQPTGVTLAGFKKNPKLSSSHPNQSLRVLKNKTRPSLHSLFHLYARVQCLSPGTFVHADQRSQGIEPSNFRLANEPPYLLSHSPPMRAPAFWDRDRVLPHGSQRASVRALCTHHPFDCSRVAALQRHESLSRPQSVVCLKDATSRCRRTPCKNHANPSLGSTTSRGFTAPLPQKGLSCQREHQVAEVKTDIC